MKFYQYSTGRARVKGYGFVAQTEGITFNNAAFRTARDLSRMRQNSVVYEMHGIDRQHVALVMTRVDSFGSGNYCYTHALISEQAAEPALLARLLRPESFLDSEGFLSLEEAQARGEELTRKELELPQATNSRAELLREFEGKLDVWHRFLGYLWNLCWQRSQGAETLQPAVLVLPKDDSWNAEKVIRFYTDCILPSLPGDMRHHASVVFGASTRCLGEFPQTTTCFILQESSENIMPMFDLANGVTISNNVYTNALVFELGKGLDQGLEGDAKKSTLTRCHRNHLPGMPPSSVNDFPMACAFQHLDLLANQNNKSMALYRQHFLGRYRELVGILRSRYANVNHRTALSETERIALRYWAEVEASEDSPPDLYADLVQKALTTPDPSLWLEYAAVLGQPCRLTENEREEDILLGRGRWKLGESKKSLEETNNERFALLMAGQLRQSDDVMLAQTLLGSLSKKTLENQELRTLIGDILQKNIQSLRQAEVTSVLESPVWQADEKSKLLKALVDERVENEPPRETLALLCPLLKKHRYEGAVPALLKCAEQCQMNAMEAELLAETLIGYADQVKAGYSAGVLALFTEDAHKNAIRLLLKELYHFDYDRSDAKVWVEVETQLIRQAFVADLNAVKSADQLLKVGDSWSSKAKKVYHCDWHDFASFIQHAEDDVRAASNTVIQQGIVAELNTLAKSARYDWYGSIVSDTLSNYVQENLDTLVSDERNFDQMDMTVELAERMDSKTMSSARIKIVHLLDANMTSQGPFTLFGELESLYAELSKSGIGNYIRYRAHTLQPETLEWEIVQQLMAHWGDPRAGWDAFFKQKGWTPDSKTSPWKDDLYPMQALRYVCRCMVAAKAEQKRREELLRFVTTGPAWSSYVRHMENQREHRAFVRDEKIQSPSVRAWLELK